MTNSYSDVAIKWARRLLTDPASAWMLASLVVLGDAVLIQLIIRFVRYTDIDWETYMSQIELYLAGERNYSAITGPTGPLVYPAGHVYIHEKLYKLTSSGLNIFIAQQIYGALYIISLALTCAIYLQVGGIPNWMLLILPLIGAQAGALALGGGYYTAACILFSLSVSVKMSVLLYMPGLFMILWQQRGIVQTILHIVIMVLLQIILAWPFLEEYPWQYLSGAFDLSRVFLFKWTVNWRFLGEGLFLTAVWAKSLLIGHLCTLLLFAHFKWCGKDGLLRLLSKTLPNPWTPSRRLSVDYITTVLMTSNLVGIVFARSLHYQFYSWYAQQIPFLVWRTRYPLVVKLGIIGSIEYAWNVFPSTKVSSAVLVTTNVFLVVGIWFGWPTGRDHEQQTTKKSE